MRVLLINACHYRRGGSETVYFNTAQLLKEHRHTVSFFSTKDLRNEASEFNNYFISNVNMRELSLLKKIQKSPSYLYNYPARKSLEQLVLDFKPDIAHVHNFYGVLSVSILKTLRKHKIPIVQTVHDYRSLCPVNTLLDRNNNICEQCKDKHFFHCLQKKCSEGKVTQSLIVMLEAYFWKYFINPIDLIDHFIFVSQFSKNKHLEFNGCYENKYSQIFNFANYKEINSAIKGDYFLFFGRLSIEKGIKTMLSVFSKNRDFKLIVAGTGPLKDIVEEVSRESYNIEYVGFRTGKELEFLIRNASFIILPSECYENNPMTIIEGYSLGKPVIGSNIGGIPEIIEVGKTGFTFEMGNTHKLSRVIELAGKINQMDYKIMSEYARLYSKKNFSPENHYKHLMTIYRKTINSYDK